MKKIICFIFLSVSWIATSNALVITSDSDPALAGATVDGFSSYAIGDVASVSDGFFTMTQNGGGPLNVTDGYNGAYGATGRSVVSWGYQGITIDFASAVSAFGVLIGGANYDWTAEAFGMSGNSLGSATVVYDVNGFFLGWADMNIGSVVLSPVTSDAVLFDNLHYVVASTSVPEPSVLALLGVGLAGIGFTRKKKA